MNNCECEYQDHPYGDTYVTEHIKCNYCYQKDFREYETRFTNDEARELLVLLLQVSPDVRVNSNGISSECHYCKGQNRFDETHYKIKHYQHCIYAIALDKMLGEGWDERRPLFAEEPIYESTFGEVDENGEELEIPF